MVTTEISSEYPMPDRWVLAKQSSWVRHIRTSQVYTAVKSLSNQGATLSPGLMPPDRPWHHQLSSLPIVYRAQPVTLGFQIPLVGSR